jgi:hypothetical protein
MNKYDEFILFEAHSLREIRNNVSQNFQNSSFIINQKLAVDDIESI